jgi:N-acetylglucosaminyldiphosphoundecaprenol N-acetyl-beta-D-mannosaminyltransferase
VSLQSNKSVGRRSGYPDTSRARRSDLLFLMRERGAKRGHRHFFYGGSPRVVETLVLRLKQRFPGLVVAGYRSPPFRSLTQGEDAADVRATNETRLDFVWVGLGTPTQNKWMAQHVGKIHAAALRGVGAAFDQRTGLEWLFRLTMDPRRLAPHYFVVNSIFVARALQQLAGWKSYARDR